MGDIEKYKHEELINILIDLIRTIERMQKEENSYLLAQNKEEAEEWLAFLMAHIDKGELKSLEKEVANRFVNRFDVAIGSLALDNKRVELMKQYLFKSNEYLK